MYFVMHNVSVSITDVDPTYDGARMEGDEVTLPFVQKMMEDFKNQKKLHRRCVTSVGLAVRRTTLQSFLSLNLRNDNRMDCFKSRKWFKVPYIKFRHN